MASQKRCVKCGYSSEAVNDAFCPVCGGRMSYVKTRLCDEDLERQWNGGHHDDFRERTKTGDYCDEDLEKNYNDGKHFHNEPKTDNEDKIPDGLNKVLTALGDLNGNGKSGSPESLKNYKTVVLIFAAAIGLIFFGFGFLVDFVILRAMIQKEEDPDRKAFAKKISVLCLILFILTGIFTLAKSFMPEIEQFI